MNDKIETMRITTRGYELSANGMIGPSQFLRYLEHIRWTMIVSSEKLPLRQFWSIGVVRSQVVETYAPVTFNEEIELSMWMSRLGRTSMDFSHDIVRLQDGAVIGRSTATIVALDGNRRPAQIGEGAREYLLSRDVVSNVALDGAPPDDAWVRPLPLRPSDHDMQQHVNHARYADFVEDTRLMCADANGYGPGDWNGRVRKFAIAYEREVRLGDDAAVRTWRTPGVAHSLDFSLMKGPDVAMRARVELARMT